MQEASDREDSEVPGRASEEKGRGKGTDPGIPPQTITLRPIGFVRNGIRASRDFTGVVSDIILLPEHVEGLYRLVELKEILVLFVFDQNIGCGYKARLHPKGDESNPEVGVFASRSPFRPNPIGLTKVKLLGIEGNVVKVKGLDAFDGTPVIDIKPVLWGGTRR